MIRNSTIPALLAAVAVAVTCAATPARAGLEIQLQSPGYASVIQAGSSPLVMNQSIGNFTTTVNTGLSRSKPTLDLGSSDISSTGGGTLIVTISENNLTSPIGAAQWLTQFSGNFDNGSATLTLQTYIDNSNTLLGTGTLLATQSATSSPFALREIDNANTTGPFALTEVLTIVTTDAASFSLDASIAYVPEPASLTLLASAMVGVGALARRKRSA